VRINSPAFFGGLSDLESITYPGSHCKCLRK